MKEPKNEGTAVQAAKLGNVIGIDEGKVQAHLDTRVRSTVEETLNAFLDAEADRLCRAGRSPDRQDTRAGHYQRGLHTKAGPVELKVPKLRTLPFETAITLSVWGMRVSSGTVSELNQKIYKQIEAWRQRPIQGKYAYVFIDEMWLMGTHTGSRRLPRWQQ